ncbi:hypothetical protein FACS1894190_05920 [Spirochaetia bacterium]|nr:hypothetical protein FACS1894190_05920 [Spirochaetia bacterium]
MPILDKKKFMNLSWKPDMLALYYGTWYVILKLCNHSWEVFMEAVMAIYDGRVFIPEEPIRLEKNRRVTLSFNEEPTQSITPFRLTVAQKAEQDRRDMEIINHTAERHNAEAMDTLEYQKDIF